MSSRNGKYGVVDSYCSQAVATGERSSACARTSSTRRDLPIPGSPISSASVPKPARAGPSAALNTASSRSRSTIGSSRPVGGRADADDGAEVDRLDRLRLALDLERGQGRPGEHRLRARDDVCGHEDLSALGPRHQASRQRSRVAEDGVRPPEGRAYLAGEDAAAIHAVLDVQPRLRLRDPADRAEDSLLVVLRRDRRPGDEDDPPAVAVDVALEEAHVVLLGRCLHGLDQLRQRGRRVLGPAVGKELIDAAEAHERNRGRSMLALGRCGRDVLPHSDGNERREVEARRVGERLQLPAGVRLRPEEKPFPSLLSEDLRIEQRSGGRG